MQNIRDCNPIERELFLATVKRKDADYLKKLCYSSGILWGHAMDKLDPDDRAWVHETLAVDQTEEVTYEGLAEY